MQAARVTHPQRRTGIRGHREASIPLRGQGRGGRLLELQLWALPRTLPEGPAARVRTLRQGAPNHSLLHGFGRRQELVREPTSPDINERGPQAESAGQGEEEGQVVTSHGGARTGGYTYPR